MAGPLAIEAQKRAAAIAAVAEVVDGMIVGLGTGSTAGFAIAAIGERVARGLRIEAVATSGRTAAAAAAAGIVVVDFASIAAVDLGIDGVDEIDPAFRAIKGAGGALLREKIVASAAARMIAVADASKRVATLGRGNVSNEVLPFACTFVDQRCRALGGEPRLRRDEAGAPSLSDQGNMFVDCRFGPIADPAALAAELSAIPGLLEHGLFLDQIDALYVGTESGVIRRDRATPACDGSPPAAHP